MTKTISCKAAIAWEMDKPMTIQTVDVEPPRDDEVRIEIYSTALCHSDIHKLQGTVCPQMDFPVVLGHEAAGVVESVGSKVTTLKPGDHVIPVFTPECGECEGCLQEESACIRGVEGLSGKRADGTSPLSFEGRPLSLFCGVGSFSQYTVCKEIQVAKIDRNADLRKVALIGCGVSTGYGSVLNSAKVKSGKSIVIFGLGAIGLSAVMGAKKAGAAQIIVVDTNPDKFQLAKELGATDAINPKDSDKPIEKVVCDVAGNILGVDYAVECIGIPSVQESAINSTKPTCGLTVLVGISPFGQMIKVDPYYVVFGRKLVGSWFGGWKPRTAIPKLVEEFMVGNLNFEKLITHRMNIQQLNEAVALLKASKCIRVMFDLNEE